MRQALNTETPSPIKAEGTRSSQPTKGTFKRRDQRSLETSQKATGSEGNGTREKTEDRRTSSRECSFNHVPHGFDRSGKSTDFPPFQLEVLPDPSVLVLHGS